MDISTVTFQCLVAHSFSLLTNIVCNPSMNTMVSPPKHGITTNTQQYTQHTLFDRAHFFYVYSPTCILTLTQRHINNHAYIHKPQFSDLFLYSLSPITFMFSAIMNVLSWESQLSSHLFIVTAGVCCTHHTQQLNPFLNILFP